MNLFDHPAPELNQLRKRGGIPHRNFKEQPFDAVLIRADGWTLGINLLRDGIEQTARLHAWRYIWIPGENGGKVMNYAEHVSEQGGDQEDQETQEQEPEEIKEESEANTDERPRRKRKKRSL